MTKTLKIGFLAGAAVIAILVIVVLKKDGVQPAATPEVAVERFFALLADGKYSQAEEYYAGDYDQLRDWNPTVEPTQFAELLKQGCEANGLVCIKTRSIELKEKQGDRYAYDVTFTDENGELYEQGPCCGSRDTTAQSTFEFIVEKQGEGYKVMTMPVYTP